MDDTLQNHWCIWGHFTVAERSGFRAGEVVDSASGISSGILCFASSHHSPIQTSYLAKAVGMKSHTVERKMPYWLT